MRLVIFALLQDLVMLILVAGNVRMDARLSAFFCLLRMASVASCLLGRCRYAGGRQSEL
jgi:hypothetical protein